MDLARPYGAISHPLDSAALTVLAGTTLPLTGREVARLAPEGTQQGIAKALNRLVEQGLVRRQEAGSAALHTLNRDHLAAPAVELLRAIRSELFNRVRALAESWKIAPPHLSIFGSAARGDGDTASDIDVFVVRPEGIDDDDPAWAGQVDALAHAIRQWTGNHAGIAQVSPADVKRLARDRPPIVKELESDAIALLGAEPRTLFRSAK